MMTRRKATAVLFLAALAGAAGLGGCSRIVDPWQGLKGSPRIVVTFPPLYSFVRGVAGNRAAVMCLCTNNGPHHYEASADDALKLQKADIFFANGLGLDDKFADAIQAQSHNPNLHYVKLGDRLPDDLKHKEEDHDKGDKHEEGKKEDDHHHGDYDPHVWLGIPQAVKMVEFIRDELKKVDADHAKEYDDNAARYIKSLQDTLAYGRKALEGKKNRNLVSFHDSLGYFAEPGCFALNVVDKIELAPGDEVTGVRLARLIKKCKDENVQVIAVEPQYPKSTSAEKLRQELARQSHKVEMVIVDPLETGAPQELRDLGAKWYDQKMRENVDNLAKSLP
jgi:zinc transport system substrate-binding protein